jgi:hypothetical protein
MGQAQLHVQLRENSHLRQEANAEIHGMSRLFEVA